MAIDSKKRARTDADKPRKPRPSNGENADAGPSKPSTAPRPAPAFVSSLHRDEGDFPRGGGTSLTAFEVKQVRDEGRREADAEAALEVSARRSWSCQGSSS
jgi:rRNA biogenesis protein RRP5